MIRIKEIVRKCRWCGEIVHEPYTQNEGEFASKKAAWSYVLCFMDVAHTMHECASQGGRCGITDIVGFTVEEAAK